MDDPSQMRAGDTERHQVAEVLRQAAGDVRPLSGIYSGGATSSMFVSVRVTRLA
jgi:hypothetical protein